MRSRKLLRTPASAFMVGAVLLLTFGTATAQGVEFQINEKAALLATLFGQQEGKAVLLVPGKNMTVECSGGDASSGTEILSAKEALLRIGFLGCVVKIHTTLEVLSSCLVDSLTIEAIASPISHGEENYILLKPDGGNTLGVLSLLGFSCPLLYTILFGGTLTARPVVNNAVTFLLLFSNSIQGLTGDVPYLGVSPASLSASLALELKGAHLGQKFGVTLSAKEKEEEEQKAIEEKEALEAEVKALEGETGIFVIDGNKVLLATATATQEGKAVLLVPGRNLKLECSSSDVLAGTEVLNATEALAKVKFLGCETFNHKTGAKLSCTVDVPEVTASLSPAAHAGGEYALAVPDGSLFTTVILLGASCPLPEENPVKGSIVALIDGNGEVKPLLLFSEAIQLLVGDKLEFGGFTSYVSGSTVVELTGGHAGLGVEVAG
jgi:hypothetical protein